MTTLSEAKKSSQKHRKTKFQESWLVDPILKLCTEKDLQDDTKSKCLYCQKLILAENYLEHVTSTYHTSRIPEAHQVIISKYIQENQDLNNTALKTYINGEFYKQQLELIIIIIIIIIMEIMTR